MLRHCEEFFFLSHGVLVRVSGARKGSFDFRHLIAIIEHGSGGVLAEIGTLKALVWYGALLAPFPTKASILKLVSHIVLFGHRAEVLGLISGTRRFLILFRCLQCPALATCNVMLSFEVEFLRTLSILAWDVLQLVSILLHDALEARVSLNREDGHLLRHRLELRVVNVHSWGGLAFKILNNANKYIRLARIMGVIDE